jgi:hypothetical protein
VKLLQILPRLCREYVFWVYRDLVAKLPQPIRIITATNVTISHLNSFYAN